MAKFSIEGQRTGDAALAVLGLLQNAATQRRGKISDWIFGSEGVVADNPFLWALQRGTAALGSSTVVTPTVLDPADPAGLLNAGDNYTVNPTLGALILQVPLNQRATFRWAAVPGYEIVLAATANLSIIARTPTFASVAITSTMVYEEQ